MGLQKRTNVGVVFANILSSDGTIRIGATAETPGAEKRDYKTPSGVEGSKWELTFDEIEGLVTGIEIKQLQNGKVLNVSISDEGGNYVLSTGADQSFASDIMRKIRNVDLEKRVTFSPYSFEIEGGDKKRKGVTVYQEGNKVLDYFRDYETKTNKNGMLEPQVKEDGSKLTTKEWKRYFEDVSDFLQDDIMKFAEESKFPQPVAKTKVDLPHFEKVIEENKEEIKSTDSPEEMLEKIDKVEFED